MSGLLAWHLIRKCRGAFIIRCIQTQAEALSVISLPPLNIRYPLYRYDSPLLRNIATSATSWASAPATAQVDDIEPPLVPTKNAVESRFLDYESLKLSAGESRRQKELSSKTAYLLRSFRRSPTMRERALAAYINDTLFTAAFMDFAKFLQSALPRKAEEALGQLDKDAAHAALLQCFADYVIENHPKSIESYKSLASTLDLRHPHTWFPMARSLKRKIIYHAGPTNSGKTFNALKAMQEASTGVYSGPLRLLALEVYDSCNSDGTLCTLVTGQERKEVPGAAHIACTVEMVYLSERVDVAVIDEIQMIGDATRGFAWTRALLGVPASEVHVCGDASAIDLVKWICLQMDEEFEVRSYDRFTNLHVESNYLNRSYTSVKPGDCIVAFSRRDIYDIKAAVEASTPYKACVIYGALPPEVRRRQARLFNDPGNEYAVMVASDAVGMGLNLNIGRVVFHSLHKREGAGKQLIPVGTSAVKQIAGRAGRRSSQYKEGKVTTVDEGNIPVLRAHLATPLDETATSKAGLAPEFDQFEAFASQRPEALFSEILSAFEAQAVLQGRYFFCRQEAVMHVARLIERVPGLSLRDMYVFAMAPASTGDPRSLAALLHWAKRYAENVPCQLEITPPAEPPKSPEEMRALESAHAIVMLWLWLSFRFDSELFPNRHDAEQVSEDICGLLAQGLENITAAGKIDEHAASHEWNRRHETSEKGRKMLLGKLSSRSRSRKGKIVGRASRGNGGRGFMQNEYYPELFAAFQEEVPVVVKAEAEIKKALIRGEDAAVAVKKYDSFEGMAYDGQQKKVKKRKGPRRQRRKHR